MALGNTVSDWIPRFLADERTFFGVPHFLNVVSNAPFLLVGLWGLYVLATRRTQAFADPRERWPYAACFVAVALTAFGSAYYHLAPDDARLTWDRLPIALAFMALVCAVIAERIDVRAGLRLLAPLLFAGALSVLYWRWTTLQGREDLLPYAIVQFGGLGAVLVVAAVYRSPYTRDADLFVAGALYALAKGAEMLDSQIYAAGGLVSGHTLKHLLAALAAACIVRMLQSRTQFAPVIQPSSARPTR
jgi:hypothetical protein